MKKNFVSLGTISALLLLLAGIIQIGSDVAAATPKDSSTGLTLVDLDGTKVRFSVDDLRQMHQETEPKCICVGATAGYIGTFDYAGVRLASILPKAAVAASGNDNKRENTYAVFKGTDGYQVIATWTELMETSEGKRILIALEKNGEPLPPNEGQLRLVLPGDKYAGRSVKCFETIELRLAEGYVEKKG